MMTRPDSPLDVDTILRQNAAEERLLLKEERQAERDVARRREQLSGAEIRLEKAQKRVARRIKVLAEAEAALERRRAARLSGPVIVAAIVETTVQPAEPPAEPAPAAPVPPPDPPDPATAPAKAKAPRRRRQADPKA
ncbi:MAG: hypothetical protein H0V24_12810 [Chloroflexia bacterium]|nr:hypothetical protein [Chloroflexia bacterium]MDQ3412819.1 hypothetical protein [Chloroflexota bacterium]